MALIRKPAHTLGQAAIAPTPVAANPDSETPAEGPEVAATKPEPSHSASGSIDELLTPKQTARLLGVGVGLLRSWRQAGTGPKCVSFSERLTRYRREDVAAFVTARTVGGV